ncbi:hypothetical protein EFD56_16535 [Rhizobium phaseoli]|uniref:hypothetical protein n=1 Tax=Rhizobium phaseoli TaxID=396 RepID=UPI000F88929E|nr:hypothetical protein [Rhizobium phaseoli]RUM17793.1 hypothetical protein EFD56_16535 [Rhizobium phaseoli]
MLSNRIRIFSELVSLDAWHLPFTEKRAAVALHADVSFSTARLGAEENSPVRFKIELRRAELKVMVPETEPLTIDRASVERIDPSVVATRKQRSSTRSKAAVSAEMSIAGGANGASGRLGLSGKASRDTEIVSEMTATQKVGAIIASHSMDADGNNRWIFKPGTADVLAGKPWSAKDMPLMKLKDLRHPDSRKLPSTVRLELSCLREDMKIYDIVLKDEGIFSAAKARLGFNDRMLAAEAFIRNRLEHEGLPAPRMSEDYAIISLAEITASEEG